MASKLSTLQEKLELLTEEFDKKKEHLQHSILAEKSRLLALSSNSTRIGERNGESFGSYFVKLDDFYYGISTRNGVPVDIEEVVKSLVEDRVKLLQ